MRLEPPRYRLSSLFFWMAVLCGLLATMKVVSSEMAFLMTLLVLAVIAHVAGNVIGTQLRHRGDQAMRGSMGKNVRNSHRRRVNPQEFAPTTDLRRRTALGRTMVVMTAAGAVSSFLAGGILLAWANQHQLTAASLILGASALGVIGGLAGYLSSCFFEVLGGAVIQAQRQAGSRRQS